MAWKATIAGTDRTAYLKASAGVRIHKAFNERDTATFTLNAGLSPARDQEVILYAKDGVTPIFGGLIYRLLVRAPGPLLAEIDVECVDFCVYADWCHTSADFGYVADVTLKEVLEDLITPYLAAYGVSLDPAQVTGPTLAPFAWPTKTVSECLRELTDKTGYIWDIDASKVLSMVLPGSAPAPWAISDGDANCRDLRYTESDEGSYTKVILQCGPSGVGADTITHEWTGVALTYAYALSGVNVPASAEWPGIISIDGLTYPMWLPGDAPGGNGVEWDYATAHGTLSFLGTSQALITGGEVISLTYYPQYPFTVIADSAVSPAREFLASATDVLLYDAAVELADGLLDQVYQDLKTFDVLTQDDGLEPGQTLTIDRTTPFAVSATALVTTIEVELYHDHLWNYTAQAVEGAVYKQATQPLSYFRSLSGGSSGVTVVGSSGGGSVTVLASPFPLGGARTSSVPMAAIPAYTPVLSWIPFVADSSFSALVRVALGARNAGVGCTARLVESADSTFAAVTAVGTSSTVTSTTLTETTFAAALTSGKWYRLEVISDTASGSVYGIGQLESTA